MVPLKFVRLGSGLVFVAGIAGMIVSSINGNNNGWVITFGICTAIASVVLLSSSAVAGTPDGRRLDVFEEADAAQFEARIADLVAAGADEVEVRRLVRDVARSARRP